MNFVQEMEKLGKHLDQSREVFDAAMMKLSTGRQSITDKAEKLKAMEVKSARIIDNKYIDLTSEEEITDEP